MMVTQQVNLFLPELRPVKDWLTSVRLLQALAVIILLVVLQLLWQLWQRNAATDTLAQLQEVLQEQTLRTEQLERDAASRTSNQALLRDINTRESSLLLAGELLDFLRTSRLGNTMGYSEYVKDLSRASFNGIWLTEIRIEGDGGTVYLQGLAQQTAMIPDFVGRLSSSQSSLRGRHFNRLLSNRVIVPEAQGGGTLYEFVLESGQ